MVHLNEVSLYGGFIQGVYMVFICGILCKVFRTMKEGRAWTHTHTVSNKPLRAVQSQF